MSPIKSLIFLAITCLFSLTVFSQNTASEDDKLSLNSGTIDNQFKYVLKKSGNFKGTNGQAYEAVKRSMFLTLQAHTIDSLKTIKTKLDNSRSTIESQQKEISSLKSNLTGTQSTLNATNL